jgi:Sec-independent protein translocase protein TatA
VLLLVVWIAVAVVVLVVLGGLLHSLLGAFGRLTREVRGLQDELRPVLGSVQETLARASQAAEGQAGEARGVASPASAHPRRTR